MRVDRCPRCGSPGYLVEDARKLSSGMQVYYFVVHKYKDGGKWRTRKCSIGSEGYIYVTKTHTLPFIGVNLEFSSIFDVEKHLILVEKALRDLARRVKWMKSSGKTVEDIEKVMREIERVERMLEELKRELESLVPNLETRKDKDEEE